jgi:hypothetical protein
MSDDFDLRLRKELRALADAVPTGPAARPFAAAGHSADALDGPQPVRARIQVRHGSPIGWSAAAAGLIIAIVAGAALSGSWRNGQPSASATPKASPSSPSSAAPAVLAGRTIVTPQVVLSFGADELTSAVLGPDGAAYVLDSTVGAVYRVDPGSGAKIPVITAGAQFAGSVVGKPRLLATGGPDVLILDDANALWRWRPAQGDNTGRGSLIRVNIPDSTSWGNGTRAVGTFVTNPMQGQYNIYVAVPSLKQVLRYQPALDGSAYPQEGRQVYLRDSQDVANVDDMYVDGNIYLVSTGKILGYALGQAVSSWSPPATSGAAPYYTRLTADNPAQDQGTFYAFDRANKRIVAFSKQSGAFVAQYAAPAGSPAFSALTAMFVTAATGGANPTLYWTESGNLMSASLAPAAAPTPLASSGPSAPPASPSSSTAMTSTASSDSGHGFTATGSMMTHGAGPTTYAVTVK